jgi:general secretion pathway protein L
MAESIVGLDVGSTGIKAVHLRRGLMGIEWVKAVSLDWPDLHDPFGLGSVDNTFRMEPSDSVVEVMKTLLSDASAVHAQLIVSVPAHLCSLRTLTLPFSDERRLNQVVAYEVEAQLPFPVEEVIVDYQILHTENGSSRILVAALPRETLRRYLQLLSRVGIDPSMVDMDAMALSTLAHYGLKYEGAEQIAVIDVGASKTTVVVVSQGKVGYARTFLQGSRHWTDGLARASSLSFDEADQRKKEIGLSNGTPQALTAAVQSWAEELARTLHVAQVDTQQNINGIVLCGGGARLKGLEDLVTHALGVEVKKLELPLLREKGVTWENSWSQAVGLALKAGGIRHASHINFRKGEFAFRAEIDRFRRKTRHVWIGMLVLLFLIGGDLTLKYRIQAARYDELKVELRQMYNEMFPNVQTIVDEVHQAQTSIKELKKKAALFGQGELSALGIIGELTDRIPKDVEIKVRELVIETERVRMEADTESFDAVDRIKAAVDQSAFFGEVEVSDAKIITDRSASKGKVRFHLNLHLTARKRGES